MKEEVITKKVYVADDGKEFIDKEECEKYEEKMADLKKHMKYYCVRHCPDLTETGYFQYITFVAVYSTHYEHQSIVEEWCVKTKKWSILGPSVMGYGFQRHFAISESNEEEFISFKKGQKVYSCYMEDQILLSPKKIEGYTEPFDYMNEWGFK